MFSTKLYYCFSSSPLKFVFVPHLHAGLDFKGLEICSTQLLFLKHGLEDSKKLIPQGAIKVEEIIMVIYH